jgi:hypothetical protein
MSRPPRAPTPETLTRLGHGIDALLDKAAAHDKRFSKIDDGLSSLHEEVLYHSVRIHKLESKVTVIEERVVDLERSPRSPAPPKHVQLDEFDDAGDSGVHKTIAASELQAILADRMEANGKLQKLLDERDQQKAAFEALRKQKWILSKAGVVLVAMASMFAAAVLTAIGAALLEQLQKTH